VSSGSPFSYARLDTFFYASNVCFRLLSCLFAPRSDSLTLGWSSKRRDTAAFAGASSNRTTLSLSRRYQAGSHLAQSRFCQEFDIPATTAAIPSARLRPTWGTITRFFIPVLWSSSHFRTQLPGDRKSRAMFCRLGFAPRMTIGRLACLCPLPRPRI
jgi:hypothetical protein